MLIIFALSVHIRSCANCEHVFTQISMQKLAIFHYKKITYVIAKSAYLILLKLWVYWEELMAFIVVILDCARKILLRFVSSGSIMTSVRTCSKIDIFVGSPCLREEPDKSIMHRYEWLNVISSHNNNNLLCSQNTNITSSMAME